MSQSLHELSVLFAGLECGEAQAGQMTVALKGMTASRAHILMRIMESGKKLWGRA